MIKIRKLKNKPVGVGVNDNIAKAKVNIPDDIGNRIDAPVDNRFEHKPLFLTGMTTAKTVSGSPFSGGSGGNGNNEQNRPVNHSNERKTFDAYQIVYARKDKPEIA